MWPLAITCDTRLGHEKDLSLCNYRTWDNNSELALQPLQPILYKKAETYTEHSFHTPLLVSHDG